jgi:hypothetical protein
MLAFTVRGENSAAALFLWELTVQCQVAQHAFGRLKEFARVQMERAFDSKRQHPKNPIEVLVDCSAFLSAAGIAAKLLFTGVDAKAPDLRKNPTLATAARRSAALRGLLEIDDLPTLRDLGVRNAFEHIDERLDRLLREAPSAEYVWLHLARTEVTDGAVLKRLNPRTLTLSYLDAQLDLEHCSAEIGLIQERLKGSYERSRKFEPLLHSGTARDAG